MNEMNPIVALHTHEGTRVLDVRTLPEDVACEIIMAAFVIATHYGNCDITVPKGSDQEHDLMVLTKATDATGAYMHLLPKASGDLK